MKYRVIIFVFYFLFLTFQLLAADTWIKTYDPFGDVDYFPEDIVVCQDGGYAVNGYYNYYDPEYGIDEEWGFLIKTDCDGNLLWAKEDTVSFMSENESAAFVETDDGGYLSAVICDWGGTALIKRDAEGSREWSVDGEDLYVDSMDKTNDGNIILGGRYNTLPTLRKITQDAEILWTQDYYLSGSGSGKVRSVIETSDSGFAATGYTSGNNGDLFVLKTDADGDSLWSVIYDGVGEWDEGNSITQNINSDLLVCGIVDAPPPIYGYGFVAMLDTEGDTLWTKYVDSSIGYEHFSVLSLPENTFVAYCYKGGYRTNIYKFDYNYNIDWVRELDGNVAYGDRCIKQTIEGGFICALRNANNRAINIGIAKTDENGVVPVDENEVQVDTYYNLYTYPNPFNQHITIFFDLAQPSKVELVIYNLKGQKVHTLTHKYLNKGVQRFIWDGKDESNKYVSSGIYFVKLSDNKDINKTTKIILTK